MPRKKMVDPAALSVAELRHLLVTKEKMEKLEERRSSLARELAAVEAEMAKLMAAPTGSRAGRKVKKKAAGKKVARKPGRPAKKAAKKVGRPAKKAAKKTAGKPGRPAKKTAKKVVKKAVKKAGRPVKKTAGKKTAKAPRATVESVVADLIRGKGSPMSFKDIFAEITKRKLVKTKSKNFANVLRRTLSTSSLLARVGRGVYDVKK